MEDFDNGPDREWVEFVLRSFLFSLWIYTHDFDFSSLFMRGFLSISRVFIDRLICFFLRFPWIFGVPKSGQSGVYLLDVDRKCSDKRTGVLPLHLFHRRREDSRRRRGENST